MVARPLAIILQAVEKLCGAMWSRLTTCWTGREWGTCEASEASEELQMRFKLIAEYQMMADWQSGFTAVNRSQLQHCTAHKAHKLV